MGMQVHESKEIICAYCDREIPDALFNKEHCIYLCPDCIPKFRELVDAEREPDLIRILDETIAWLKEKGRLK